MPAERAQQQWQPVAMSTPSTQDLVSKYYPPIKRNQDSLEKWLIIGMGQREWKMSLDPESEEILNNQKDEEMS